MSIGSLARWLRDCYRDDRSRVGVRDFFSSAVTHRRMTRDREKVLVGLLDNEHVPPSYAEKACPYTHIHRKERDLIYGALFVCGKSLGKIYRAPLVIAKAVFEQENDGVATAFSIQAGSWRLNPSAIEILDGDDELEEKLLDAISGEQLNDHTVGAIRQAIGKHCKGVDATGLLDWPYLAKSKEIEAAGRKDHVLLLAACGLASIAKSSSSRGVLDELGQMSDYPELKFSSPVRALYSKKEFPSYSDSTSALLLFVPATLSEPQEKILRSARKHALTVCHGPPGTGKSFTLAAIALDHISRGESVLVVSRGDHAVDVLHQKIDEMLDAGEATVRAGRKQYLRELKNYLELCLSGRTVAGINLVNQGRREREIEQKIKQIQDAEKELEFEFANAIARGAVLAKPDKNWIDRIRIFLSEHSVSKRPLLSEMVMCLELLHSERERMVREYGRLERQCKIVKILDSPGSRRGLKDLLSGLRKLQGSRQEEIFKRIDFNLVFEALPIWLTKCDDVHRVLPFGTEQFDVVIIDEASQCDLASVMPVLQRAKRAVIAGDTKQLRHVSFLPEEKLKLHAVKAEVGHDTMECYHYRDRSLMDVACDQVQHASQTGFLDEHFRSHQSIISFSSKHFYHSSLRIMKERPWVNDEDQLLGERCRGVRGDDGVNQSEIRTIIDRLKTIINNERNLNKGDCSSIGVLSPFRAQVDAVLLAIQGALKPQILNRLLNEHQLAIGTAHNFQGEERDVMLISFCIDDSSSLQTRRFLEREDVFNVSVTRAKVQQWVYYSINPKSLPIDSLLGSYIRHVNKTVLNNKSRRQEPCVDEFANDVANHFENLGVKVIKEGVVAGLDVDLVLIRRSKVLGIDLVGYPGKMTASVAQRKAQLLGRAGLRILPLGYMEWHNRRKECSQTFCNQLGVSTS